MDRCYDLQNLISKNKQAAIFQLERDKKVLLKYASQFNSFEDTLNYISTLIKQIEEE